MEAATRLAAEQGVVRQQQAEATRLAAEQEVVRQQQAEATRLAAEQEFLNRPFVKQDRQRTTFDDLGNDAIQNFVLADLGYEGRARTEQYQDPINLGNTFNMMNLPAAPVLHPYDPEANNGPLAPAFTLNVKLRGYDVEGWPEVLRANLAGIAPANTDAFLIVQDMPWIGVSVQLKPQYWLEPDAPTVSAESYGGPAHTYTVKAGIFSNDATIRIQGQPAEGLFEEPGISIHNAGPGTPLVSSGSVLNIENLNPDISQVLWSLTKYNDKVTGDERAAIVQHVLLNQVDEEAFEQALMLSNNLADLQRHVGLARAGGHFATLDLDELF